MTFSREDVQHIASLCRIGITEDDLEAIPGQLSHILELFQVLQEMDTEDVDPTGQSASMKTVMRPDEAQKSLPREDALANAPQRNGDLIQVNQVLEE